MTGVRPRRADWRSSRIQMGLGSARRRAKRKRARSTVRVEAGPRGSVFAGLRAHRGLSPRDLEEDALELVALRLDADDADVALRTRCWTISAIFTSSPA